MTTNCNVANLSSASLTSMLLAVWLAAPLAGVTAPMSDGLGGTGQTSASAFRGLGDSLRLSFPSANAIQILAEPSVRREEGQRLLLAYEAESPDKVPLHIARRIERRTEHDGVVLFETFSLSTAIPLTNDIDIEIPFMVPADARRTTNPLGTYVGLSATCPLKNGWAKSFPLSAEATCVEYRLGSFLTGKDTPDLALPLVQVQGQGRVAAIFTDPMFSTLFSLRSGKDRIYRRPAQASQARLRLRRAVSMVQSCLP